MRVLSIQIKVVSIIILILAISISTSIIVTLRNQKKDLIDSTEQTLSVNTNILNTVIRNIMLSGQAPIAKKTLSDLQKLSSLTEVSIYRVDGTVAFNDFETLDKVNDFQDKVIFERTERLENSMLNNKMFSEVLKSKTPIKNEDLINRELEYYFPILNYGECRSCHGDEEFIRGIAHFKISLNSVYDRLATSRMFYIISFSIIGLIITLSLIIAIKRQILTPVKVISSVVNEVGNGNLDKEVVLKNRDELGQLGETINIMTKGLKERNRLVIHNRVIEASNRENKKYLDNIQEGLLLLDNSYNITGTYSKYFSELFNIESPKGLSFPNLLFPDTESEGNKSLISFLDMIQNNIQAELEMIMEFNPINNTKIELQGGGDIVVDAYFARVMKGQIVENIMVIFKDRTKIVEAENLLKEEKRKSQSELEIIGSMLKSGTEVFLDFKEDCNKLLQKINKLDNLNNNLKLAIIRDLHTIKGTSRYLGFYSISDIVHNIEDAIETSNFEEILLNKNQFNDEINIMKVLFEKFQEFVNISTDLSGLQNFLLTLPDMVKDISNQLGKEVNLKIDNKLEDIPYLKKIKGVIIHIIRNSIDHGIEESITRISNGKKSFGIINLNLYEVKNNIHIEITDNGQGLDFNKIATKARELGLIKGEDLKIKELTQIIFTSKFSSKDEASNISGRGVGLDAVKNTIDNLGGTIGIKTKNGIGTMFHLTIPKGGAL